MIACKRKSINAFYDDFLNFSSVGAGFDETTTFLAATHRRLKCLARPAVVRNIIECKLKKITIFSSDFALQFGHRGNVLILKQYLQICI